MQVFFLCARSFRAHSIQSSSLIYKTLIIHLNKINTEKLRYTRRTNYTFTRED